MSSLHSFIIHFIILLIWCINSEYCLSPNKTETSEKKTFDTNVRTSKSNLTSLSYINSKEQSNLLPNSTVLIKKLNSSSSSAKNDVSTFRLKNTDEDTTCILMTVDALVTVTYPNTFNEVKEGLSSFIPDNAEVRGNCRDEESSLILKWKSFSLIFNFTKTPGNQRWYVKSIQLTGDTKELPDFKSSDKSTKIRAQITETLFPTPVGKAYKCHHELTINLYDENHADVKVKVLLRELTMQPFLLNTDSFGSDYLCSDNGLTSHPNETAPFIFGSLLAILSLVTIAGYAIYRHLKVNKVQYDTME